MSRIVANSLSTDGSKLVAVDATGNVHAWILSHSQIVVHKVASLFISNPSDSLKGARVMLQFLDARTVVVLSGSLAVIIDVDHLAIHDCSSDSCDRDPPYMTHRVGLPCVGSCISNAEGSAIIGCDQGLLYVLGKDGRINDTYRIELNESITAVRACGPFSIMVGTNRGTVLIFDTIQRRVKSSWRPSGTVASVSWISVDPRGNWFCAALNTSLGQKSWLVSGSTRTLVKVFESAVCDGDLKRCEFVDLLSKGLSILSTSGSSSSVSVRSLDLSSEPRNLHEGVGGVVDVTRTASGDMIAICGPNRPIQILSGASLSIVRQLVVD